MQRHPIILSQIILQFWDFSQLKTIQLQIKGKRVYFIQDKEKLLISQIKIILEDQYLLNNCNSNINTNAVVAKSIIIATITLTTSATNKALKIKKTENIVLAKTVTQRVLQKITVKEINIMLTAPMSLMISLVCYSKVLLNKTNFGIILLNLFKSVMGIAEVY